MTPTEIKAMDTFEQWKRGKAFCELHPDEFLSEEMKEGFFKSMANYIDKTIKDATQNKATCPICFSTFPPSYIERHKIICAESKIQMLDLVDANKSVREIRTMKVTIGLVRDVLDSISV